MIKIINLQCKEERYNYKILVEENDLQAKIMYEEELGLPDKDEGYLELEKLNGLNKCIDLHREILRTSANIIKVNVDEEIMKKDIKTKEEENMLKRKYIIKILLSTLIKNIENVRYSRSQLNILEYLAEKYQFAFEDKEEIKNNENPKKILKKSNTIKSGNSLNSIEKKEKKIVQNKTENSNNKTSKQISQRSNKILKNKIQITNSTKCLKQQNVKEKEKDKKVVIEENNNNLPFVFTDEVLLKKQLIDEIKSFSCYEYLGNNVILNKEKFSDPNFLKINANNIKHISDNKFVYQDDLVKISFSVDIELCKVVVLQNNNVSLSLFTFFKKLIK